MRVFLSLFLCFFLFFSTVELYSKNVIYIVIEGVSRDSLYSLIKKGKLPNYNKIIARGNYRNLGINNNELKHNESTFMLYSGFKSNYYVENSFFEMVQQLKPDLTIRSFLTTPIDKSYNINTEAALSQLLDFTNSGDLVYVKSLVLGRKVAAFINDQVDPFFLVVNYTNVDYIGWRYREGSVLYSQALINTDRSIGKIISALKEKGVFEDTEFLITTNYGYHIKTQLRKAEGWIVSTKKSYRKGRLDDIYPSLLDLLELDNVQYNFSFNGKSLFKPSEITVVLDSE
jgi:predicted AlkP superfamily pyrophosphatase or phosphodiesterase